MEYYTNVVLANVDYSLNGKAIWSSPRKSLAELGGDAWAKKFHIWTMDWDEKNIDLLLDGKLMNHFDLAPPTSRIAAIRFTNRSISF